MATDNEELDSTRNELDLGGIEDTTSDEQLEIESGIPADGEAQVREPESEAPEAEQDVTPENESSDEPAEPKPRMYSEDEWRKAQSSWQRQIDTERNQRLQYEQALMQQHQQTTQLTIEQQAEQYSRQLEANLAEQVGEAEARRQVRAPAVQNALRTRLAQAAQNEALQQQVQYLQGSQQQNQIAAAQQEITRGVTGWLKKLQTDYKLDKQAMRTIVRTVPNEVLQDQAALERFAINSGVLAKTLSRGRVPRETSDTQLESGLSSGDGAENPQQRVNRILDKPAWEWTEADIKAMKR